MTTKPIPIPKLIDLDDKTYTCDKDIFSFVNRCLNLWDMQAVITDMSSNIIKFRVTEDAST